MSETKSIYNRNKKQEISEKGGGQKTKNWSKPAPKEMTSFKSKEEPSWEITAAAFNTWAVIVADSLTEHQIVRQNSTKMLHLSVLRRGRLHIATALQTELLN